MVLLSAQGMDVATIAKVAFTSEDRVRDVIHNFNADGFSSLYPKYKGGRPPKFTLGQRREIKKIAKSRPAEHDLPFPPEACRSWRNFWWPRGWSTTSAMRACGSCSARKASPFNGCKPGRPPPTRTTRSRRPRVEHLYAIANREVIPEPGEPEVIFCVDEFGPLNLQPHPGRQWAAVSDKNKEPGRWPRPRWRATYTRTAGVRHLFAAYELGEDKAVRAHQATQEPGPVAGVLPLPALPLPTPDQDRNHLRQLQPAPDHQERQARRAVGRGQQYRDLLHAD
jgi:hypothetical protein